MIFRRRRQSVPIVHAPVPELSDATIAQLVHDRLAEMIGPRGEWSLARRRTSDTDEIFDEMLTDRIATHVSASILREKARLHGEGGEEPQALAWKPAPVAVWVEPVTSVPPTTDPLVTRALDLENELQLAREREAAARAHRERIVA